MKKNLLLLIAMYFTNSINAQITEVILGQTTSDMQTNRSMSKRISNNGDGTISAIWLGNNGNPNIDRGTFYAYFDGTIWHLPSARIESLRTGFPNIIVNANGEYVLAHTNGIGMNLSHRPVKGIGIWTDQNPVATYNLYPSQADVWSKLAISGSNGEYIHAIVNSQGTGTTPVLNMNGPLTYSRSDDYGATWSIDHIILPGMDFSYYPGFGAENYHIDGRGNTVAIVTGIFGDDVALWKSIDNGNTWTKIVIDSFPIPNYNPATMISDVNNDGIADSVESNIGDVTVSIDNNGLCHVAYGRMIYFQNTPGLGSGYYPLVDGLYYWNENMTSPTIIASAEDFNGNGVIDIPVGGVGNYNTGLTCQPSIGFDGNNNIFISYATYNELADTTSGVGHRHVYAIASLNAGVTWTTPLNILFLPNSNFHEGIFPSLARLVDNNLNIIYQRDPLAGSASTVSDIVCAEIPKTALNTVFSVEDHQSELIFFVSQNIPNPAKDKTSFSYTILKISNVKIEIYNSLGQLKYFEENKNVLPGKHFAAIDVSKYASGVYCYSVTTNNQKISHRMIVE